ncbi:MAG: D-alanyl-D-alanine carboxypeptidase [Ruminococcus sp.]|nr:D-alanyl-D-alanine carboxypeptidase [Ruminococcus sp.]
MDREFEEDAARRARWAQRKIEMRRRKRRQEILRKLMIPGIAATAVLIITIVIVLTHVKKKETADTVSDQEQTLSWEVIDEESVVRQETSQDVEGGETLAQTGSSISLDKIVETEQARAEEEAAMEEEAEAENQAYEFKVTEDTISLGENVVSSNAIFVDTASQTILARKDETNRIVPASMTKVLTLLIAVEHIENMDDTFVMTEEILHYCYVNDCSVVGFEKGETVPVKDLLYGSILHSGADAALGLAEYVAGSQEDFVALMNAKLEDMGLADSAHFTNCIGIYDTDHYCSVYDMAVIMQAAVKNMTCREVLSAHTYTTSVTEQHPEGIEISNWFLRRIEDKDTGGEVICAKTGYVLQSGNCAVSYGMDTKGREYICVTVDAYNKWKCTEDHVYLYKRFSERS